MTAFKLHHTKFYTRHTINAMGTPHCYRCDEILANDNRQAVRVTATGFAVGPQDLGDDEGHLELTDLPDDCVMMGAFCALKAIAGF